jgi:sodium/potassium-transporting ATPase subunit alpha
MQVHGMTAGAALAALGSSRAGLGAEEARRRLAEHGPNRIQAGPRTHPLRRLVRQFTHFLALLLWAAVALAFVADAYQPGEGMRTLGWAILGVILVNGAFSAWQEHRAEQAVAALRRLLPSTVKVLRDGALSQLPAADLVRGDLVLVEAGDQIPADARVIEGTGLAVSTATLTGEAVPEPRWAEPDPAASPGDARNVLLAGTFVVSGHGRAVVFATGAATVFGQVAKLAGRAVEPLSPMQREIVRLGRVVAVIATGVGAVCFALGLALGHPLFANVTFALGIIVANVPEGLLPAVTISLAMGSQRMARRNAVVRRLGAVEALGSATVICTDKTGTLTQNRMEVARLYAAGEFAEGPAWAEAARRHPRLFEGALLCHGLRETRWRGSVDLAGDPMEVALYRFGEQGLGHGAVGRRERELPFDWSRRRLTVLHHTPEGHLVHVKGALEEVLPICSRHEDGHGKAMLGDDVRAAYLEAGERMAREGLRVLAFAWGAVREPGDELERGLVLAGLVGLRDPLRPGVSAAIERCQAAGIRVVMVTGDHPATAEAVARQVGLVRSAAPRVVRGEELRAMDEAALAGALAAPELLFARVDPADKLRIVTALQRRGEVVAVTGDGVNDAPALRAAHIGVAMGASGTDVAREAADLVLADDDFASIVAAVEEGRAVFDNIRKFLTYILTSNVPELVPYLAYAFAGLPLALTVIQILAIDLGTDMVPALALGAEPPHPDVMHRPPRSPRERLLGGGLLLRGYGWLGLLEAAGAMAVFLAVLWSGGWRGGALGWGDPLYLGATTACLGTVVVMQAANVFACRSPSAPAFAHRPLANRLLAVGIGLELLLLALITFTRTGQLAFRTAPPPAWSWLAMLGCAAGLLALEEGRKALVRRRGRLGPTPGPRPGQAYSGYAGSSPVALPR